jgi:hypothetical protein
MPALRGKMRISWTTCYLAKTLNKRSRDASSNCVLSRCELVANFQNRYLKSGFVTVEFLHNQFRIAVILLRAYRLRSPLMSFGVVLSGDSGVGLTI